jgi:hypothetical protein
LKYNTDIVHLAVNHRNTKKRLSIGISIVQKALFTLKLQPGGAKITLPSGAPEFTRFLLFLCLSFSV